MKIIAPHISCVVNLALNDEDPNELEEAINQGYMEIYVVTPNGIIKHHKLRGEDRYLRLKVASVPGVTLNTLHEEINFLPRGKIPHSLLQQIEVFFRRVMEVKKDQLEAMIWVLFSETLGYYLHVPDQVISKASVRYDWASLPAGSSIICDIHSHNTMGAFFSGTDNNDDRGAIGFSGVFGRLDKPECDTVWRFNYWEKKYEATMDDIFECPHHQEVAIPDEWVDKVKTVSYQSNYTNQRTGSGAHIGAIDRYLGYGRGANTQYHVMDEDSDTDHIVTNHQKAKGNSSKKATDSLNPSTGSNESDNVGAEVLDFLSFANSLTEEQAELALENAERNLMGSSDLNEGDLNDPQDMLNNIMLNDRYNELMINKGAKVATSFCLIMDLMAELDGENELISEVVEDMACLLEGSNRTKLFKSIWDLLPVAEKSKIQTNGF